MSDDYRDPSGNTEAFRAFAAREQAPAPSATPAAPATNRMPLLIGGVVVAVVVVIVLVLALS
ncbi:hypothetical protein [Asanoa iriomotensis]|nr:hypothetical protein [Asanoa iriomotensis]